jgi:preprotein translocase subunit SecD
MKNLFLVLGFVCLQYITFSQNKSRELPDGLYIVTEKIKDTKTVNNNQDLSTAFVKFNAAFKDDAEALLVNKNSFVPLEFSKEPIVTQGSDGKKRLELLFNRLSADKLAVFTSQNIMREATIIADGEALTVHKIRSAITEGKLEISGCSDNVCETIRIKLNGHVK